MVRRTILSACILVMAATVAACTDSIVIVDSDRTKGSGTITTQDRNVGDFEKIVLAGEGTVLLDEGPAASLSIETDDNLLTHIESTVSDGVLHIATEAGVDIDPTDSVIYRVTTPDVTDLTLSGAGRFDLADCDADTFTITLSGAGDIDIGRLAAKHLDVTISGVGQVTVAGEVNTLNVTLPGAGSYDGRGLESTSAVVTTSGAASAAVWATDTLEATVSGVGSIDYFGSPEVTQSVTGVGSINWRGEA